VYCKTIPKIDLEIVAPYVAYISPILKTLTTWVVLR